MPRTSRSSGAAKLRPGSPTRSATGNQDRRSRSGATRRRRRCAPSGRRRSTWTTRPRPARSVRVPATAAVRRCRRSWRDCEGSRPCRSHRRAAACRWPAQLPRRRCCRRTLRWIPRIHVAPNTGLNVCDPAPNSGVLVLPRKSRQRRARARRAANRPPARSPRKAASRTSCERLSSAADPCARSAGRAAGRPPGHAPSPRLRAPPGLPPAPLQRDDGIQFRIEIEDDASRSAASSSRAESSFARTSRAISIALSRQMSRVIVPAGLKPRTTGE